MVIKPSPQPGPYERHLLRKANNPLFPEQIALDDDSLLQAQRQDHERQRAFATGFQTLLEEVSALQGNVDSELILKLKDKLDQTYELVATLGGDQSKAKQAIRRLLDFIMAAVRRGAGTDRQAHQELDQEEAARTAHFQLLGSTVVADILNPEHVIPVDELVPTLLSIGKDELQLTLQLFDEMQLLALLNEAAALVDRLQAQGVGIAQATENLAFMQGYAEFLRERQ
jgi:hypothetical protein